MRGEFIDVGGPRLYYFASGTRGTPEQVPIILIHGFPTSSHLWQEVVPMLPVGHRCVVPDLVGYGRSGRLARSEAGVASHVQWILSLLDALRIREAVLVGHELGASIALMLALTRPEQVTGLVLVNPSSGPRQWSTLRHAALRVDRLCAGTSAGDVLVRWMLSHELRRAYNDRRLGRHSVDQYLAPFAHGEQRLTLARSLRGLLHDESLGARISELRAVTYILGSAKDTVAPIGESERLHAAIAGSALEVADDVGHFIPEEAPERVVRAIINVLAQ
ncbi:MAG: alpha/beta fold hydrolase [Gemmatimonadaceae bacterium]